MATSKPKPRQASPSPDELQGLDDWAERIAAMESDVAAAVARYALRLAGDRRLAKGDRDFAQAQADAVRRAVRRAKAKAPATAKGKPKGRRK